MSVKILGGMARGFPLATPRTETTKPTSVMVRRKLFDWRQNLEGEIFIDLCAGSGAMGFEAFSRGAEQVFLNDSVRPAFLTLKQNSEKLLASFPQGSKAVKITSVDALKWITHELPYQIPNTENCILYLDPPYENHQLYLEALRLLKEASFQGEVWIESDRLKGPGLDVLRGALHAVNKTVEQGDHFVVVGKLL